MQIDAAVRTDLYPGLNFQEDVYRQIQSIHQAKQLDPFKQFILTKKSQQLQQIRVTRWPVLNDVNGPINARILNMLGNTCPDDIADSLDRVFERMG
jgi:hypothetical protein